MKRIYSILLIGVFTALLFSCKKDDTKPDNNNGNNGNNTTPKTPKELLVGTWLTDSAYTNEPNGNHENILTDCSRDNTVTFQNDGTYTTDAGAIKCSPQEDQTMQGTWNLDAYPALTFKVDGGVEKTEGTITLINEQYLKYDEPSENGQYSYTTVLKRK